MKGLGKCLIVIALAASLTFPAVSCIRRDDDVVVVPDTMSALYVGNYDGGMGHEWLEKAIAIFEERNKNTSFEPGKTGVKVVPKNDKDAYMGTKLLADMSTNTEDLYITGTISYADFVAEGVLADVTDVMTAKEPGQKSIAERMNPSMQKMFNVGENDEARYYGAPSMASISGIVYDVDLFEEEKLYIAEGSTGTNIQWTGATGKSAGMDNKPGTYDDGLPETWEQFKRLLTRMVTRSITPFTWGGMYNTYAERFLNYIWASYEGVDDYMLNYTFNGVDSDVGKIDKSNGYLLQKQNGKLAALTVAEYILSDSRLFYSQSVGQSHIDAQDVYLTSVKSASPIAMLLEGSWWENEAKATFNNMVKDGAEYAYGVRRFAYMPFPKFVGTDGVPDTVAQETAILCDSGAGCIIVNKNSKNLDLAKKFYAFLLSEEIQALITATTGVALPFEYELSEEQLDGLTYYSRSIWELMHDENSALVYPALDEPIRVENTTYFADWNWAKDVTVNGRRFSARDPMHAFYQYSGESLTAKTYFDGLSAEYSEESWNSTLGKYFLPAGGNND